jgi:hypothetical protein
MNESAPVFPPPPLKFRTVGFPQYGFKREVHGDLRATSQARAYTPRKGDPQTLWPLLALQRVVCHRPLPSRGPWLASGLCCPVGSLLTMASSETLVSNHQRPELPQFTLHVFTRVPHSVPRRIVRLLMIVSSSHILPSPSLHWLGIRVPQNRFTVACLTRLQVSLYATARRVCSPCTGQDFYFRAFVPAIAHRRRRV